MAAEVESSSLDDFFAKKDKKKTKKSKVLSELNALSQTEEKPKKKKAPKEKSSSASNGPVDGSAESRKEGEQVEKPADEWVEIEEKADADYSGLKIQSLRLEEREAAAKEEAGAEDDDAAGNGNNANDGPWKKIEVAPVASEDHTEVVSEAKEATPPSGKYVPPSVRAAQRQQAQQAAAPLRRRNNKLAPDVNDQESFPTLGGGGGSGNRSGNRSAVDAPKSYTSLHLQNKWDSLSGGGGSAEP